MSANDRTYKYRVSFTPETAANFAAYEQKNITYQHERVYTELHGAMAKNGIALNPDQLVHLERNVEGEMEYLDIEIPFKIPKKVQRAEKNYLVIESIDV